MPRDTILGWVPQGNPPSIAAGGYGWFDLYAVLLAPTLVAAWDRHVASPTPTCSTRSGRLAATDVAEHLLVQQPVRGDAAALPGAVDAVDTGEPTARLGDDERPRPRRRRG